MLYRQRQAKEQEYLMRVYGPLVHGAADISHLIQLFGREVSKKSPHASAVLSQLADVFFVRDSSDKERELDKLAASNGYARVKENASTVAVCRENILSTIK